VGVALRVAAWFVAVVVPGRVPLSVTRTNGNSSPVCGSAQSLASGMPSTRSASAIAVRTEPAHGIDIDTVEQLRKHQPELSALENQTSSSLSWQWADQRRCIDVDAELQRHVRLLGV
jgi:hypothetical protein